MCNPGKGETIEVSAIRAEITPLRTSCLAVSWLKEWNRNSCQQKLWHTLMLEMLETQTMPQPLE